MSLKNTGNIISNVSKSGTDITGLYRAVKDIGDFEKAAEVLSKVNGLSDGEKIAALANGFDGINKKSAAAALGIKEVGNSVKDTAVSTSGFGRAFAGLADTIGVSTVGLGVFTAALAAAGVAIFTYRKYQKYMLEQVQSANLSGTEFQENLSTLDEQKAKVDELKTALESGTLTEQEAYQAKSDLFSIQQQLSSTYGDHASGIDLVNGKLETQIALMDQLTVEEANRKLNEDRTGFGEANKQMNQERQYTLGALTSNKNVDEDYKKAANAVKDVVKEFDSINLFEDQYGSIDIKFTGDATEADETINAFANRVRELQDEYGTSPAFESILQNSSTTLSDNKKILETYRDTYKQYLKMDMFSKGLTEGSPADIYNKYMDAVNGYNEALNGSDTTKIQEAKTTFDEVSDSVKKIVDETPTYSTIFDDIGEQLNQAAKASYEFENALSTDSDLKSYVEDLKNLDLSDVDLKLALDTDGIQEGEEEIEALIAAAQKLELLPDNYSTDELQSFLDILVKFGIISGVPSAMEETASSIADLSTQTTQLVSEIDAVNNALASQGTGKSISYEAFTSDELSAYSSALEYNNGCLQLNAEKVKELTKARAEEQIAENDAKKLQQQAEYLENAGKIEDLRQKIRDNNLSDSETLSINTEIDGLLANNDSLVSACDQLDVMSASLREATGAYQEWLNAQNGPESGDMFRDAQNAMQHIRDTADKDSDSYGRTGTNAYAAAVDFIIPESVDQADAAAVQSYMDSISHLFTYDDNGKMNGMDLSAFCEEAVSKGLMTLDEAGENYELAGQMTMKKFAEGMGLALPLVQAMFGEMEEFEGNFDWSDEAIKTLGDLGVAATEAAEELRSIEGNENLKIDMDVSGIESAEEKIKSLDSTIQEMQDLKGQLDPEIDATSIQNANDIIQYCIAQKQQLNEPVVMKVQTGQVEGEISNVISKLQEFQSAQQNLEVLAAVGADTSEAEAKVSSLASELQGMDAEIMASLNIDTSDASSITESLASMNPEILVTAGIDSSAIDGYDPEDKDSTVKYDKDSSIPDGYQPEDKSATVKYGIDTSAVSGYNPPNLTRTVTYVASGDGSGGASGTAHTSGTAHKYARSHGAAYVQGNAKLNGDWGMDIGQRVLIGELGPEIVVDPISGRWRTYGDNGAEFAYIPKNAIIFNHLQSESLLNQGFVNGRGKAMASGTAFASGTAMVTGGIAKSQTQKKNTSQNTKNSASTKAAQQTAQNTASTAKSSAKAADAAEKTNEKLDFIEILLDRLQYTTDRYLTLAEGANSLSGALGHLQSAINNMAHQHDIYSQAYSRYHAEANAVALDEGIKNQIRNGSINIQEFDEDTQKKISEFQKWFEKTLSAQKSIDDIWLKRMDLAKQKLDKIVSVYDGKSDIYAGRISTTDSRLNYRDQMGYSRTSTGQANHYKKQLSSEKSNQNALNAALKKYRAEFNSQVNAGLIKKGSTAWYEAQKQIESYTAAIYDSKTAIESLREQIRTINFTKFQNQVDKAARWVEKLGAVLSLKSARGQTITEADYRKQETANNTEIAKLNTQRNAFVTEQKRHAVNSVKYQELAASIASCDSQIFSLLESNEELKKSIRDVRWKPFEDAQEKVSFLIDEINNLINLQKKGSFIDEDTGEITSDGYANMALIAQGMELQKQKIADYRTALEKLDKELKSGNITQDEYNQLSREYIEIIQTSVNSVEDYKDSITDLFITQQEKMNDLLQDEIKLRKEALNKKKSYYDYDKKLSSKNKDINNLKSQIAALEGVSSASARAELARLKDQLADAEEEKKDLVTEHEYSVRSDSYDKLSEDANDALEKLTKAVQNNSDIQQEVLTSMLGTVVDNYADAFGAIEKIVKDSGIVISGGLSSALSNLNSLSSTNKTVDNALKNPNDTSSSSTTNNINTGTITTGNSTTAAAEKAAGTQESTANRPVITITLDTSSATIKVGKTKTIKVKSYEPSDAKTNFKWKSSNSNVATVSGGTVKGIKVGTATITCYDGTAKKTCSVKVEKASSTMSSKATLRSSASTSASSAGSLASGANVNVTAQTTDSKNAKWYKVSSGGKTGWVKSTNVKKYAKGVKLNSAGTHLSEWGEAGREMYMTNDGSILTMMQPNDSVIPNKLTENLFDWGKVNPDEYLRNIDTGINPNVLATTVKQEPINITMHYDSLLTVEGNVDRDALPPLKTILNEAYKHTSKNLMKDMEKYGYRRR